MVDICPFQGYRYNSEFTGPLDQLTAPPYDVIKADQQEALYAIHPHNIVRLILAKELESDSETDNRYTRTAQTFKEWRADRILVQDEAPSYYVYQQEYSFEGKTVTRTGFFARVRLEDFSAGSICPHEFTLAKAKKDRSQLIKACKANFSPVFGLFSDTEHQIDTCLEKVTQHSETLGEVQDGDILNRFWRVTDPQTLEFISERMQDRKIYIADGHHRYETALAYHKEFGNKVPDSAHIMMFLTNLDAPSLSVYPIHRQVRCPNTFDKNSFLAQMSEYFDLELLPQNISATEVKSRLEEQAQSGNVLSMYLGKGSYYLIKVQNPDAVIAHLDSGESPELKILDVVQLHTLILKGLLGIDTKDPSNQSSLSYTIDISEAQNNVDAGSFDLAFFLNPTPVAQVRDLAEKGIRLPQKSTYFYPKLLSGLVINAFEE